MSASHATSPDHATARPEVEGLRVAFEDADLLGMVYAETYRARRDNLPHARDEACQLDRDVEGCDGLCALAVAQVISDVVGYYARQVERGTSAPLKNPGGYARQMVRLRHLDIVRALTTPDGAYQRPDRLTKTATRPAYLPLSDDIDGILISSAMLYLRSGSSSTTWEAVCRAAANSARRQGYDLDDDAARDRLDNVVSSAIASGGRAETFVRRELLDPCAARAPRVSIDDERVTLPAIPESSGTLAEIDGDEASHALVRLVHRLDERLRKHGGWARAGQRTKVAVIADELEVDDQAVATDLADAVDELTAIA